MQIDRPAEMPWDIFNVDMVIDSTGRYGESHYLEDHLGNGAPRILLRTLPVDTIDRIVIPGISDGEINSSDRMISAGSATTTALCLLLHVLSGRFEIECGSMTTIHAYTSDQALQDYAAAEPLGRNDFVIARGRALAKHGRGNRDQATIDELQRLYEEAEKVGLKLALPALKTALAST